MTSELTEASLEALVARFYRKVRADVRLGPIFEAAVTDWDEHHARLTDFWSSVMLATGRYKGAPLAVHGRLPIAPEHFEVWLALWRSAVREQFTPDVAATLEAAAERIGRSLSLGLFFRPGSEDPDLRSRAGQGVA